MKIDLVKKEMLNGYFKLEPGVVQNSKGMVNKSDTDMNNLLYTGKYHVAGTNQRNTPYQGGWTVETQVYSSDYVLQIATNSMVTERYMRLCQPSNMSDWRLIAGSRVLYESTTGFANGSITITKENLSRFGRVHIFVKEYASFLLVGDVNTTSNNVRAMAMDINNATSKANFLSSTLGWGPSNNNVTNAKSYLRIEGAATNIPLTVTKIVGLP